MEWWFFNSQKQSDSSASVRVVLQLIPPLFFLTYFSSSYLISPSLWSIKSNTYMRVAYLKYSCTIRNPVIIQKSSKPSNLSVSDLQELLLLGLDLSFLYFRCKIESKVKGLECTVNNDKDTITCWTGMSNAYSNFTNEFIFFNVFMTNITFLDRLNVAGCNKNWLRTVLSETSRIKFSFSSFIFCFSFPYQI